MFFILSFIYIYVFLLLNIESVVVFYREINNINNNNNNDNRKSCYNNNSDNNSNKNIF